jgi:hypothetical protein
MRKDALRVSLFILAFWGLAAYPKEVFTAKSANFTVEAPDRELANDIANKAETLRAEFSKRWFGESFRRWYSPCPISVVLDKSSGSGTTNYTFDRGEVGEWKMQISGTREGLLENVVPHEVSHAVMATYYRKPIPRWADEGFASRVESQSERSRLYNSLLKILKDNRAIAFGSLFAMVDYPEDKVPLYAEGFTLTTMLIEAHDEGHFLNFLSDGITGGDWSSSVSEYYGYRNLDALELAWKERLKAGGF